MKTSIIIPAYNQGKLTIDCLGDVLKTCEVDFEVLLVNDGSTDIIYKLINKLFPPVKVLNNQSNLGFIKSVNYGMSEAKGDNILLLNNDIRIKDPKWLKKMLDGMSSKKLDMCSVAGGNYDKNYNYIPGESKNETDRFSYLVGWCLLFKRRVLEKIGMFDEQFGSGFWDDVDFCYRAKKNGFKLGIVSGVEIEHLYHATFKASGINVTEQYNKNRQLFMEKIGAQ